MVVASADSDPAAAENFSGEQDVGLHARHHDFGHAGHFLLEHAAHDVLPVEHDHHVQHKRDHGAENEAHDPAVAAPAFVEADGFEVDLHAHERIDARGLEAGLLEASGHERLPDRSLDHLHLADGRRVASGVARRVRRKRR